MKYILCASILLFCTIFTSAQEITGDWEGTLHAGADLHLILHITKDNTGALKATLDSVDQGANGIPVSSISWKDPKLNLGIDAVHGSYEGTLSKDGQTLTGTWSQGQSLPLAFKRSATPKPAPKQVPPSDIDGAWMGTIDTGMIKLRVVFHIVNTADGLIATLDSLDQNVSGMPTTKTTRDGMKLKIEADKISGKFEGTIAADLNSIDGTWTQGGSSTPLKLTRAKNKAELELKRPQNPTKPYPYRDEDVSYDNKVQDVTLAATLTIPQGKGPFPAVVLITGSGAQDRDESLMGHKPFLVLADYLTRHGIVVLRADDRGTAKSTGNFSTATTPDFATDTEAGIAFLKTRPEVNPHEIGLIGHSEGGVIAPMIAARNPDVAFIVMMAGSGVRGDEILAEQVEAINLASGKSQEDTAKHVARERAVLNSIETESDPAKLRAALKEELGSEATDAEIDGQMKTLTSPWFKYFITYDPAPALRKVKCPVLAMIGEKDTQVPAKENLPAIRAALEQGGNTHFEVVEMPGLNHLFQTAKTGSPMEYSQIEETMSPTALEKMSSWILKTTATN